jgi:hypothetical protein
MFAKTRPCTALLLRFSKKTFPSINPFHHAHIIGSSDGNLVIAAADGKNVLIEGGDDVQVDLLAIEPAIQAELKKSVDAADALAGERERKAE